MTRIKQQENFGRAVRAIRSRLELNQADFGARIGCNQNTISRYEAGKLFPSNEVLMAVWRLADRTETHLLRAYVSELFSFADEAEGQQFLDSTAVKYASAGLASPAVLAQFEHLYEHYMMDPDATRLFNQAATWLETEFKMRAARCCRSQEDDRTEG